MMARLLPHPLVSLTIFVLWMMLNETMAPGPALVGVLVALLGGRALARVVPTPRRRGAPWRRLGVALRLAGAVAVDIARSNYAVARVILGRRPERRAGFIRIPLALREPEALAMLACILTATPGSAWVDHDPETGILLLHVLDLVEEEEWVALVKQRYEAPLMEIFG